MADTTKTRVLAIHLSAGGTTAVLAGIEGAPLAQAGSGPGDPTRVGAVAASDSLRTAVLEVLDAGECSALDACCIGMAGRAHPVAQGVLQSAFYGLPLPRIRLLEDERVTTLDAAFEAAGHGLLVMADQASGAAARGPEGVFCAGGFGPELGDEGSAHALGLAALRTTVQTLDGRSRPTALTAQVLEAVGAADAARIPQLLARGRIEPAELFPLVAGLAREGDATALWILDHVSIQLSALACHLAQRAGLEPSAEVATCGAVLGSCVPLRDALMARLREGGSFVPGAHVEEPVLGALQRARAAASSGETVPPAW